jgi:hypothetical protein
MLDVRGKLAIENNNEKVVHPTCLLKPQSVSLALTLHSLSRQPQYSIELTARFVLGTNWSLADVLFSSQPEKYKLHETQRGAGSTACPVFHPSVRRADWKSWVAI